MVNKGAEVIPLSRGLPLPYQRIYYGINRDDTEMYDASSPQMREAQRRNKPMRHWKEQRLARQTSDSQEG